MMERQDLDYGNEADFERGNVKSRLYLDCVTPEDAGQYTCVGDNGFLQISSAPYNVNVLPSRSPQPSHCNRKSSHNYLEYLIEVDRERKRLKREISKKEYFSNLLLTYLS